MLRLRSGNRNLTPLDEDKALQVCELIAMGHTLPDIAEKYKGKLPSVLDFTRWLLMFPHVKQAYEAAMELRTYALEEEAIDAVREAKSKPSSVPGVRALIAQLQWSMEKGNQNRYGQKGVGQITVPVQINTTMNLGQPGAPEATRSDNIYEVSIPSGANLVTFEVPPEGARQTSFAGRAAPIQRWNKLPAKLLENGEVNPAWVEFKHAERSKRAREAWDAKKQKDDGDGA